MLGVRMEGGVDQLVGHIGSIELSGVEVVHAQLDGPAEHGQGRGSVAWRTRDVWSRKLHGAVSNARHGAPREDGRAAGWIDSLVDRDHLFAPLTRSGLQLSGLRGGRTTISPTSMSDGYSIANAIGRATESGAAIRP